MQKILAMPKNATFEELLSLFCSSAEFSEIAFRQAEKTVGGPQTVKLAPGLTRLSKSFFARSTRAMNSASQLLLIRPSNISRLTIELEE